MQSKSNSRLAQLRAELNEELGLASPDDGGSELFEATVVDTNKNDVIVELGPRDGCTRWTRAILGERPHLAVALDRAGRSPLAQLAEAARALVDGGVDVDLDRLAKAFERAEAESAWPRHSFDGPTRRYPAHPAPLELPPLPSKTPAADPARTAPSSSAAAASQPMPLAPALPPIAASAAHTGLAG